MNTPAPAFAAWLDDFFDAYYRRRPVNATFIGIHDYDDKLPDYSSQGAGDTVAEMRRLLRELQALPNESLTDDQVLDRKLAEGFLRIQLWEFESHHFYRGNPAIYTGEAVFGVMSHFLSDFAPFSERVASAIARMEAIPSLLEQGRANVREAPRGWTERAIRECQGALLFLRDGLEYIVADEPANAAALREAADGAAKAFASFQRYLSEELLEYPVDDCACGESALDLMMQWGHFLQLSADEVVTYAEAAMAEAGAYLDEHAADFGASSPEEALAKLADHHPTTEAYYDRYGEVWHACRATAESQELLTWPEFPIRYVPRPAWSRKAAPYLYFLYYRSPAAFNRPPVHKYLVTPIDASMPAGEQEERLRANNDSVIKLNHVVHHGAIGHHVQNWHAFRAPSRVGRVAAVDCAARIAMFCGGTMAEGWACYTTDLMAESGFLTPLEVYANVQSRRRMCARAIVDVRLHQGRMTLQEAADFYEQEAGMGPGGAKREAVKNSMFPGGAMMYLLGADRIKRLRETMKRRWGKDFTLRRFHDRFLSYGSIPVTLIAAEMEK